MDNDGRAARHSDVDAPVRQQRGGLARSRPHAKEKDGWAGDAATARMLRGAATEVEWRGQRGLRRLRSGGGAGWSRAREGSAGELWTSARQGWGSAVEVRALTRARQRTMEGAATAALAGKDGDSGGCLPAVATVAQCWPS